MGRRWELTVWDIPRPQGRMRVRIEVNKNGRKTSLFPEKKDDEARYMIRKAWVDTYGEEPLLITSDLALSVLVYVPATKSMSLKRRKSGEWPRRGKGRGDLDNYVKAIQDALKGFAYVDDDQIQMFRPPFWKQYALDQRTGKDTRPCLFVALEEL